jgi:hypothetical protein
MAAIVWKLMQPGTDLRDSFFPDTANEACGVDEGPIGWWLALARLAC